MVESYALNSKYTKDKDYRRSPYRKRRKSRELRSSQRDTNTSTGTSGDMHHQDREPAASRPRAERTEAERVSIVLGGPVASSSSSLFDQLPPPPPAPILSDDTTARRDNYEVVAMDVDTSSGEGSRPPTRSQPPPPVRDRLFSEGDEVQLRNVLLLQMQQKGGGNTPNRQAREDPGNPLAPEALEAERPPSVEFIHSAFPSGSTMVTSTPQPARGMKTEFVVPGDEAEYKLNKTRLGNLDRVIQTRMHQIEKADEEREKLMKALDEVIGKMATYQTEYWAATEERDRLRPLVENYEAMRIRRLSDVDSLRMFTTRMNQHSDNLLAIASTPLNRSLHSTCNNSLAGDIPRQPLLQQHQAAVAMPLEQVAPLPVVEVPPPVVKASISTVAEPPTSPASPVVPVTSGVVVMEAVPHVSVDTPPPDSPPSAVRDEPMEEASVVPQERVEEAEEEVVEPARHDDSYSHEGEEKEQRLRAVLLEKLKIKQKADEAQKALVQQQLPQPPLPPPVEENGQQDEEEEEGDTQMDEYLTSDADNDENQENQEDSERLGAIHKHREHVRRVYKSLNLPLRLLPHAGVPLPNDYERQICPFELNGRCKDYSCEFLHYNDDKLTLRELMSMILFFAPELSGEAQFEEHTKQLDHVLSWQNQGEEREQFVRRVLRRLPQTRNDVDARQAVVNDETGDFDAYYSSLNIVKG